MPDPVSLTLGADVVASPDTATTTDLTTRPALTIRMEAHFDVATTELSDSEATLAAVDFLVAVSAFEGVEAMEIFAAAGDLGPNAFVQWCLASAVSFHRHGC